MQLTDLNPERRPSQRKRILKHLQDGGTLTSLEMIALGIVDGRKRISELRAQGHPILSRKAENPETKARYNIYYMDNTNAVTE